MVNILARFYETEVLNKYTRANFDNIYKDLLANYHWDLYYEFGDNILQTNLASSIDDLAISDEIKNALRAFEKRELLWEDFPPIVWEIPNLKKNCFKQKTYETLKELARNCYFFHSSYVMEYGFDDAKWFAVQTEFKDSKDLLNEDKDKRFEQYLRSSIVEMKSFIWGENNMDATVVDHLIGIFQRADGGYIISKDKKYVVISGCEYKNCTTKGLVFIDTEDDYLIALIRHLDYQPDKTDSSTQSDDWLILSMWHDKYEDLPKEFIDAVTKWRLVEGQAVGEDALPLPRIIRFVGGFNKDIEVLNYTDVDKTRDDRNGWLGVRIKQIDKDNNSVVVIDTVTEDGPAYLAGVMTGDIILSLNNKIIVTKEELLYLLSQLKADQIVDFKVIRKGKRIDLNVKLGAK